MGFPVVPTPGIVSPSRKGRRYQQSKVSAAQKSMTTPLSVLRMCSWLSPARELESSTPKHVHGSRGGRALGGPVASIRSAKLAHAHGALAWPTPAAAWKLESAFGSDNRLSAAPAARWLMMQWPPAGGPGRPCSKRYSHTRGVTPQAPWCSSLFRRIFGASFVVDQGARDQGPEVRRTGPPKDAGQTLVAPPSLPEHACSLPLLFG